MQLRRALAAFVAACVFSTGIPAWAAAGACSHALRRGVLCEAANAEATRLLRERNVAGAVVVQDVRTGNVVSFAAYAPPGTDARVAPQAKPLGVGSALLPLSPVKVLLA